MLITDAELEHYRRQARSEFGRVSNVFEPMGYGRMALAWTVERYLDGKTRRYYGLTFEEAMQNARDKNEEV